MLRFLTYVVIGTIVLRIIWFIIRKIAGLVLSTKQSAGRYQNPPTDSPQDHAYKNIEDADFEEVKGDSDKPS